MTDVVDQATRSRMMAGIKARDTKPEIVLRKALHARGLRYRLHCKGLPGRPDLVFPKFRAVVFIHGCFWHRHQGCRFATTPGTRPEFWAQKFAENMCRDQRTIAQLHRAGWRTAVVWECGIKTEGATAVGELVHSWLVGTSATLEIPKSKRAMAQCKRP